MAKNVHAALLLLLASSLSACGIQGPPPPEAQTLNAIYEVTATWNAKATASQLSPATLSGLTVMSIPTTSPLPSSTATPTATPGPSPTSSIVEATPNGTEQGPIEIGTPIGEPLPGPGEFAVEAGTYTSLKGQRVRSCESVTCPIVGYLTAGRGYDTQAITQNEDRELWVCLEFEQVGPAQVCARAAAWWFPGQYYGKYIKAEQ